MSNKQNEMSWGQAGCLLVVLLPVLVLAFTGCRRCSNNSPPISSVGDIVILDSGSEHVVVYKTLADVREFDRLSRAEDKIGLSAMLFGGRLQYVDPGTEAKIIELHAGAGVYSIRIHDGKLAGYERLVRPRNARRKP